MPPIHQKGQLDSHPGSHSIKPVSWTAILAVIQSNQSTGQPSWLSLNETSKLDSNPGSHSIRPISESWRPIGRLKGGVWGGGSPPRKDLMTAAVSQQLWTSGGALIQRAQEPNIPFGNPSLRYVALTIPTEVNPSLGQHPIGVDSFQVCVPCLC